MDFSFNNAIFKPLAAGFATAVVLAAGSGALRAQTPPPVLVILDQSTIQYGPAPLAMLPEAVNEPIKAVGLRDALPYFTARVNESMTLASSADGADGGNDGWFAIRSVPETWQSEAGANDGLTNFWLAGPGLGSPDDNGERTSLLTQVPDVAPLHGPDLNALVGRQVCAVVYDGDVTVRENSADLNGVTLGVAAFEVSSVNSIDGASPTVTIKVLNAKETCRDSFDIAPEAPASPDVPPSE